MKKGFTLVELIVSISIFALITALLLARYSKFNQGLLLTNLAYDVAINIRKAQSYGISVKSFDTTRNYFDQAYGLSFTRGNVIVFFADLSAPGLFDSDDPIVQQYTIKNNHSIYDICVGPDSSSCSSVDSLYITFKRPDPDAIIVGVSNNTTFGNVNYARITLRSSDGTTKRVEVRQTGQISVAD